jgi:hypothetical protein
VYTPVVISKGININKMDKQIAIKAFAEFFTDENNKKTITVAMKTENSKMLCVYKGITANKPHNNKSVSFLPLQQYL